jgi:gluconate 2-dehydrogenase gamma chain
VLDAHAAHAFSPQGEPGLSFLTAAEAADVEAVAAQIVPSDDTAGAREAGVLQFIDRALATFFSQIAADYRDQLAYFQAGFRRSHPEVASFASLPSARQREYLHTVDRTPFFETTRLLTLIGMFSSPSYGGNRAGVGWTLLGFEDRHVFQPPFGYYDRGYAGFTAEWERAK